MECKNLHKHVRSLITLEETSDPMINCYLNLENIEFGYRNVLDERIRMLRKNLKPEWQKPFEEAMSRIDTFLKNELHCDIKGAAIFSRSGAKPFFLPLEFRVPLPNWITVNTTPNIYHLCELKDTYSRFVVMLSTEKSARIFEINLGAVTEQMWVKRPQLRERVGREWTKQHYQRHRMEKTKLFIKEKIRILEKMMIAKDSQHFILAGNPQMTARIRKQLPRHIANKLVDIVPASGTDKISDVVAATLLSFIEAEEKESQDMVEKLRQALYSKGLAVVGTMYCLKALQRDQVDVLILANDYPNVPGFKCLSCGAINIHQQGRADCHACGGKKMRKVDTREEMVRMAEKNGCHVEVVNNSKLLMIHSGVGCLLRYLTPEQYS